jgi:predicted HicB family RNase H-like nuclease
MRVVYRSRKAETRKRFTFRLQADRHAALMAAARERGVSANALLTEALVPILDPDQGARSGGSGR